MSNFAVDYNSGAPLVTVVTAVLNGGEKFEKSIKSVIGQSYRNFEYIVIDGGSADRTLEIIEKYSSFITFWSSGPDAGIYDAWNKALLEAKGEWVIFLGADDELFSDSVSDLINSAKSSNWDVDFISGKAALWDGSSIINVFGRPWSWKRMRSYMCVAHTGAMHRRSLFSDVGVFDPTFRIAGDYDWLLRAGPGIRVNFIDKVLVKMGAGGLSNANPAVFREARRAKIKNGACGRFIAYLDSAWARAKWEIKRKIRL